MNSCSWTTRLSAYHDGELSSSDAMSVETHLAGCSLCQRELRDYRRMSLMVGRVDIPDMPVGALSQIKRQIRSEGNLLILRVARRMTGVAAAVLVAGCFWLMRANADANVPTPVNDWEAAAVSPNVDATQQNPGDVQLAEWIQTDLARK
jgi:anti-sigma factor RsiW